MTTMQRTDTVCDFCGYGGPYTRPEDFTRDSVELVDLCRWCTHAAYSPGARTESGRHLVSIGDRAWSCTCGETFRDTGEVGVDGWPWFVPSRIRRAVPDLTTATAVRHVQEL